MYGNFRFRKHENEHNGDAMLMLSTSTVSLVASVDQMIDRETVSLP